jgi:hypothetical protein
MKCRLFVLLCFVFSSGLAIAQQTDSIRPGNLVVSEPISAIESMESFAEENKRKKSIQGYRVQIFNGTRQEAQKVRVTFVKAYPDLPVTLTYDAPEYRVQAGNFRTKLEAEKLLAKIRQEFRGSFVVRTQVDLPQLPD